MLSRENRIQKKKEIDKIFKEGVGFKEGPLILKILKNNFNHLRFCFIISKKVSLKAYVRNKIRRRLRELAQARISRIKDSDNLFIVLPGMEKKTFKEMEEIIEKLFKKAKVFYG